MILVAPTAFKGTLSAPAVADATVGGIRRVTPDEELRVLPVSDGGDGLIDALAAGTDGELITRRVADPLGRPVDARILLLEDRRGRVAVVESADACGLHRLAQSERNPMHTHSRGVGELLLAAAREDVDRVVLGLGGSATVDGGVGMARALGWGFRDETGAAVADGGAGLGHIDRLDAPMETMALPRVVALCDVDNPLLGERGAAPTFARQKGASDDEVRILEAGLARLARQIERQLGEDVAQLPGGGAAGGLGAGCHAFAGATLVRGSDWVLDRLGFQEALRGARLVVTGEGRYDAQSAMGKITGRIIDAAASEGVPVLLVAGTIEGELPERVTGVGGAVLDRESIARLVAEAMADMSDER